VGTIALFLARQAREVLGMELSSRAVADARQNARLNGLGNASFLQGAVEKLLPRLFRRDGGPDVLVLDPPRRGCHRSVLETLARCPVPRVVYVSCDPGTLARDLGLLAGYGYRVVEVQPVDMFPQTCHVECVSLLERPASSG
jgi:23S rRNA (uracil1939-C5)-methyltransferase